MEEIVLSKRQQGKTRMLIEMCHADKYSLIVCPNRAMCELTFKMAQDLKMPIPMPITFEVFARRTWSGRNINNFYFDELQMSLQSIAGHTQIKTVVIDTTFWIKNPESFLSMDIILSVLLHRKIFQIMKKCFMPLK